MKTQLRRWSCLGVAVVAVVALAACSNGAPDNVESSSSEPGVLKLALFGGTYGEAFSSVIPQFEEKFNAKVELTEVNGTELISKLISERGFDTSTYDLVMSSPSTHYQGEQAELWEPLSTDTVPNMADLRPGTVINDEYVAWAFQSLGIVYNTEALKEAGVNAPKSWTDLWSPDFANRLAVAPITNAYTLGFIDVIRQLNDSDIDAAKAKIEELSKTNIHSFPLTPTELDQALQSKEVWAAPNGSLRSFQLQEQGAPVEYVYPEEGALQFVLQLDVLAKAASKSLALEFLNYVLSPDVQTQLAEQVFAVPANTKAEIPVGPAFPTEEQIKNLILPDWQGMNVLAESDLYDWWTTSVAR